MTKRVIAWGVIGLFFAAVLGGLIWLFTVSWVVGLLVLGVYAFFAAFDWAKGVVLPDDDDDTPVSTTEP